MVKSMHGNSTTPVLDNKDHNIVRSLIRHIQSGGFNVGDRLPSIRQLAENFQVSASVIRDAMMQVQTMGLVRILPRSGAFIQSVDYAPLVNVLTDTLEGSLMQVDHNLFQLLEARQLLEVECVRQAAKRRRLEDLLPIRESLAEMEGLAATQTRSEFVEADVRFHLEIARIAGNPVQVTILRSLLGLLRPHLARLPWTGERRSTTLRSHVVIYETLVDGEVDRAREEMHEHLQMAYHSLLKHVRSVPDAEGTREVFENGTGSPEEF
jgi:GntR family transcriptional repressor for pyruvate dehydrogenase complex